MMSLNVSVVINVWKDDSGDSDDPETEDVSDCGKSETNSVKMKHNLVKGTDHNPLR